MAHTVSLTWTASADAVDGYNVYRGTSPGAEGAVPINGTLVTGTSYIDANVADGASYDYYVTASANGIESLHSNEVQAVILPAAPTNLVAKVS
jgi:fibronectin type 3 domain-containing protein